jgi:hypothetical protein
MLAWYVCAVLGFAALMTFVALRARRPCYIAFDRTGMRVWTDWNPRFARWEEIKQLKTSGWLFDYIVLRNGRRILLGRSFNRAAHRRFMTRAKAYFEALRDTETPRSASGEVSA